MLDVPVGNRSVVAALQIAEVALTVRDLPALTAFYRDVVGLSVIREAAGEVCLGAGGVGLLRLLHRSDALPDDPGSAGLFHNAFLLPTRTDLGRWLARAHEAGIRPEGAADHLVSEAIYLSDPEGNGVEIYADRTAADWTWTGPTGARQVEMANAALDMPGLLALAAQPWRGAPDGTRIGHVHLRVGAIDAAVAFYTGVLGLDVTRRWPEAAFMSTSGYHHHIATNVWRSRGAGPRDAGRAGLAWVTMVAADEAVANAITRRAGPGELRDPWGTQIKIVTMKDTMQ